MCNDGVDVALAHVGHVSPCRIVDHLEMEVRKDMGDSLVQTASFILLEGLLEKCERFLRQRLLQHPEDCPAILQLAKMYCVTDYVQSSTKANFDGCLKKFIKEKVCALRSNSSATAKSMRMRRKGSALLL